MFYKRINDTILNTKNIIEIIGDIMSSQFSTSRVNNSYPPGNI